MGKPNIDHYKITTFGLKHNFITKSITYNYTLAWSQSGDVHSMPFIPAAMESFLATGRGSIFCLAPGTRLNTMAYLASLPDPVHIHHSISCSIFKYSAIDCSVLQDISALRSKLTGKIESVTNDI
jgi:hypothetical protein